MKPWYLQCINSKKTINITKNWLIVSVINYQQQVNYFIMNWKAKGLYSDVTKSHWAFCNQEPLGVVQTPACVPTAQWWPVASTLCTVNTLHIPGNYSTSSLYSLFLLASFINSSQGTVSSNMNSCLVASEIIIMSDQSRVDVIWAGNISSQVHFQLVPVVRRPDFILGCRWGLPLALRNAL